MPILAICTLRFWVKHTHTWRLHEMEQQWHTILLEYQADVVIQLKVQEPSRIFP